MFSTAAGTAMRWLRSGVAQAQTVATTSLNKVVPSSTPPRAPGASAPDVSPFVPGGDQFLQPDQTTCGSSSLVMAKMINTPAYGQTILGTDADGHLDITEGATNTDTGATSDSTASDTTAAVKQRFDQAVLAMHRTTGGWKDSGGAWQLPWPTQLGTPPWAVAREMGVAGGSGRPGSKYGAHLANPLALGASYDAITAAVDAGECVPLFIGDDLMARHVVLVTGHDGDGLSIYDPSAGVWVSAARNAYVNGNIGVAGWSQPWFVVTPS